MKRSREDRATPYSDASTLNRRACHQHRRPCRDHRCDVVTTRSDSETFARAFSDIKDGFKQPELWGHLAWQDIKQRYRRSVIGPLWITISQGVIALGLGLLYSQLFGACRSGTFLPYITTGFIIWNFILGCLTDGTDTFIANEGLIKQLPAPLSVYALRTVWRQTHACSPTTWSCTSS